MTLSDAQQELYEVMSDASEFCYFAGWMNGTEFRLWSFMTDPQDGGDWGREILKEEVRVDLKRLSDKIGGWIIYRSGNDVPREDWGPAFVALIDWLPMYEAEKARLEDLKKRLGPLPRRHVGYREAFAFAKRTPDPETDS